MKNFKFITALLVLFVLATSCSYFKSTTTKSNEESHKIEGEGTKEKVLEKTSQADLNFYNKYIEVSNKISETADELNKNFLTTVPDPSTISKGSFILVVGMDIQVNNLERLLKEYRRSYYEGGELSKLTSDNPAMKEEIETSFRELLKTLESYYSISSRVTKFYKDKEYKDNVSKAAGFDKEMKDSYKQYDSLYTKFKETVKKYKPVKVRKNPDDYTNKDEKAVIIVQNALENTMDGAENFYSKFESVNKNSNVDGLQADIEEFQRKFDAEKKKIESTEFSDKSRYVKFSFEDYFTKMTQGFIDGVMKFNKEMKKGKMNDRDFGLSYDNVIRSYNYMINAYNSSITTVNTFKVY
ncbi:MAG: DUF3829 domain-containing protein [Bacteroidetes bacterium]|nr:DUF3829 domain-containing protein [Bacteroidota bacterium]